MLRPGRVSLIVLSALMLTGCMFFETRTSREIKHQPNFRLGYDDLLSTVGMADAATLGARFGIDVHDIGFWTASLDVLRGRMADYEALAGLGSA